MNRIYAGFGSRETPSHILDIMRRGARRLGEAGWTLRSGHAISADQAFEDGAAGFPMEVYLPWAAYNIQNTIPKSATIYSTPAAWTHRAVADYIPGVHGLQDGVQKLFRRNLHIGLGYLGTELPDFGICWTRNGAPTGGTRVAMELLKHHEVPVFNLGEPGAIDAWEAYLERAVLVGPML